MRDPARIAPLLQKLEHYWRKNPDLRLGQIVENAKTQVTRTDTFYVEDEQVEEGLKLLSDFKDFVDERNGTKNKESEIIECMFRTWLEGGMGLYGGLSYQDVIDFLTKHGIDTSPINEKLKELQAIGEAHKRRMENQ